MIVGLLLLLPLAKSSSLDRWGPRGCKVLGSWLDWLVHNERSLDEVCVGLETKECLVLARGLREDYCEKKLSPAKVDSTLRRLQTRYRRRLWSGSVAFTISSWNNWAVVKVFLESFLKTNPYVDRIVWVVADRVYDPIKDIHAQVAKIKTNHTTIEILTIDDLAMTMRFDPYELAIRYELKTFNTAIKPHVFQYLLQQHREAKIMYFDPDIHFYSDLDEVLLLLQQRSLVVMPHMLKETPADGKWQTDLQILRVGIFNLGFLGVSRAHPQVTDHFLTWWGDRLRYQGGVDLAKGLHFDQAWATFIVAFYPMAAYAVLDDPRYNAAYWNLHERGDRLEIVPRPHFRQGGGDLVFFHFSGVSTSAFDVEAISPHQTRYVLSRDFPHLAPLFLEYANLVGSPSSLDYGFDFLDNGVPVAPFIRHIYMTLAPDGRRLEGGLDRPAPYVSEILKLPKNPFTSIWDWLFQQNFYNVIEVPESSDSYLPNAGVLLMEHLGVLGTDCGMAASQDWVQMFGSFIAAYATQDLITSPNFRTVAMKLCRELSRMNAAVFKFGRSGIHNSAIMSADDPEAKFVNLPRSTRHFCAMVLPVETKDLVDLIAAPGSLSYSLADPQLTRSSSGLLATMEETCGLTMKDRRYPHRTWWRTMQQRRKNLPTKKTEQFPFGINVIGHFGGIFGVARSAEYMYRGLVENVPVAAIKLQEDPSHVYREFPAVTRTAKYAINFVVMNFDIVHEDLPRNYPWPKWQSHYNIAYWAYEFETLPETPRLFQAALAFDEIWGVSNYTSTAIKRTLRKNRLAATIPVRVADVGVGVPVSKDYAAVEIIRRSRPEKRREWNFDDAYVFLVIFDCKSVVERKNPIGAVLAFKAAFDPDDSSVRLVVKHLNCGIDFTKELSLEADGYRNVIPLSGHFHEDRLESLKHAADCYVSLHRSEGYGLNLLEAILDGTPVIATNYGGIRDFTQHLPLILRDRLAVSCDRVTLETKTGPYRAGGTWCDPHFDDAVRALRYARDNANVIRSAAVTAAIRMRSLFAAHNRGKLHGHIFSHLDIPPPGNFPSASLECYWIRYPDLRAAFGTSRAKLQAHYDKHAARDGRSASCEFFSASIIRSASAMLK